MQTITKPSEYNVTGTFEVDCSIRVDKDSTDAKRITLAIVFDDVPLKDIITKALSPVKIAWQNGPGRTKWNQWTDRQKVTIDFKSPSKQVKTRDEKIVELATNFMKAGIPEDKAIELATKAIDNPEVLDQ